MASTPSWPVRSSVVLVTSTKEEEGSAQDAQSLARRDAKRFAAPPDVPQDHHRPHPYPLRTAPTSWARACNSALCRDRGARRL